MKKKSLQPSTSIWQKTALVLLGLFLSVVLLEAGLRLGGFILLSVQEYGNLRSIKQKGAYRILCLGESTTQGQYPHLLEEILNERHIGVRFSVIDKGRMGTNTRAILSQTEAYLDQYHPDMVVAMMGVNDWGEHIPFETPTFSRETLFIRSFRTYKLARLLWFHLLAKAKAMGFYEPGEERRIPQKAQGRPGFVPQDTSGAPVSSERSFKRSSDFDPQNGGNYFEAGRLHLKQGELSEAEDSFKKALQFNPENDSACVALGWLYLDQGKFPEAESLFERAITINPQSDNAYTGLGRLCRDQGQFPQAEDSFKKALELNPKNDQAYFESGLLDRDQGKLIQAGDQFTKVVQINPKNDRAYLELGWLDRDRGEFIQAEDLFRKAIQINPENDQAYIELAWLYRAQGKFSEAEASLKKASEIKPESDRVYRVYFELGLVYRNQGKFSEAADSFRKALELNPENPNVYFELGGLYRDQGQFLQAEELFKQAIGRKLNNVRIFGAMSSLYEQMGKPGLAKEYAEKINGLSLEAYAPLTANSYRKLKEILGRRGIKLVCVQYPMRNLEPLKKIFEKDEGVIFVDNEQVFKEALKQSNFKEYFKDMFAGDFGHCTPKGNKLLAQNIADAILGEVSNKK